MKMRQQNGLSRYPDQDLDYDRYQRDHDPERLQKNERRDYPIPLKYNKNPPTNSQSQLLLNRKKQNMVETLIFKKIIDEGLHKDPITRLFDRDNARIEALRLQDLEKMEREGTTQPKTKKQLEAERAAITAKEVAKKCDKPRAGIHMGVLPLFSQSNATKQPLPAAKVPPDSRSKSISSQVDCEGARSTVAPAGTASDDKRRHWEHRPGYIKQPEHQSRIQLLQDRKFWAKNDLMLLGDLTFEENPQLDSFK